MYNHVTGGMIHPGTALYLAPGPTTPWIDPHMLWQAVDEFSNAVIEGDLGAARLAWKRLAPDIEPSAAVVIIQALSEDDVVLLRRVFA